MHSPVPVSLERDRDVPQAMLYGKEGGRRRAAMSFACRGRERRSQFYCLLMFKLPTRALSGAETEVISVELEFDMGHVEDRLRAACICACG